MLLIQGGTLKPIVGEEIQNGQLLIDDNGKIAAIGAHVDAYDQLNIIKSYYLTGVPIDLVRAIGTFFFLWLGAEPMLEKLDRVKLQYGMGEDDGL